MHLILIAKNIYKYKNTNKVALCLFPSLSQVSTRASKNNSFFKVSSRLKSNVLCGAYFSLMVSSISLNFFDKLLVFSKTRALSPGKPWLDISFKTLCKTSRSFLCSKNSEVDSYKAFRYLINLRC